MNNYIIDPAVFYWINVLGTLQTLFAIIGAFLSIAGIVFVGCYYYQKNNAIDYKWDTKAAEHVKVKVIDDDTMTIAKTFLKWAKITSVFGIIFIIVSIFIPGKVTSIEMLVARTATFDNVNMTVDGIKELVDYIINAIKSAI